MFLAFPLDCSQASPRLGSLVWWSSMPCAARAPRASTHYLGSFTQASFKRYSLLPGYCQLIPAHRSRALPALCLRVVFVLKCLQPVMKGGLRRSPRQKATYHSYHLRSPENFFPFRGCAFATQSLSLSSSEVGYCF